MCLGECSKWGAPLAGDQLLWRDVLPGRGDVHGEDYSEYIRLLYMKRLKISWSSNVGFA